MSWSADLFVSNESSLEAIAQEMSDLLGIPLQRVEDESGVRYRYSSPDFVLDLYGDHGMENDRDMNFEDYPYQLSLSRLNTSNPEQARANTLKAARQAFEKLKAAGRYRLMLVEDVQRKLDSFEPG